MRGLRHIIIKDLLLQRFLIGLWILAWAGYFILSALAWRAGDQDFEGWERYVSYGGSMLLQLNEMLIAALVCVRVVQQDPPSSSTAHWRTLPVSPMRLLFAKLTLLLLLLGLFPAVVELVFLLCNGAGLSQSLAGESEQFALRCVHLLFASAIGASTRGIRGVIAIYLMFYLGVPMMRMAGARFLPPSSELLESGQMASLYLATFAGLLLLSVCVLFRQYLRSFARGSFLALLVGFLCLLSLPLWWSWDFHAIALRDDARPGEGLIASPISGSVSSKAATEFSKRKLKYAALEFSKVPRDCVPVPLYRDSLECTIGEIRGRAHMQGKLRSLLPYSIVRSANLESEVPLHSLDPDAFMRTVAVSRLYHASDKSGLLTPLGWEDEPLSAPAFPLNVELRKFEFSDEVIVRSGSRIHGEDFTMLLGEAEISNGSVRIPYRQLVHYSLFSPDGAVRTEYVRAASPRHPGVHIDRGLGELVLVNRSRSEAVVVANLGQDRRIDLGVLRLARGRLKIPCQTDGLCIDEAWLRQASLVFVRFDYQGRRKCPIRTNTQ